MTRHVLWHRARSPPNILLYGKPNTGIVMVLIKKMKGKMIIASWKQVGVN